MQMNHLLSSESPSSDQVRRRVNKVRIDGSPSEVWPHGRQLADFPKQVKPEGTWERNLKRYWRLATSYQRLFCSDTHMLRWSHILMNWGARVNLTLRTCYMIIEAHVRASILISSEIWSTQGVQIYGILNLPNIFLASWKISHFVEYST